MGEVRLIQDCRDSLGRPTIRTIAEALQKLEALQVDLDVGHCEILALAVQDRSAHWASLMHISPGGQRLSLALPTVKGCWATTTSGARIYFCFEALRGARVDQNGNVRLATGDYIRAVTLDFLKLPFNWSDLEYAIVFLTVCYCDGSAFSMRPMLDLPGVDFHKLPTLQVHNVKELHLYINKHILTLPRDGEQAPFKTISREKLDKTLDIVGIQRLRGRKRKVA